MFCRRGDSRMPTKKKIQEIRRKGPLQASAERKEEEMGAGQKRDGIGN